MCRNAWDGQGYRRGSGGRARAEPQLRRHRLVTQFRTPGLPVKQALTGYLTVADLREVDDHRQVEVVNPWSTLIRQQNVDGQWTADLHDALPKQGDYYIRFELSPKRRCELLNLSSVPLAGRKPITIEWDAISSYFDALHLNWDPARFAHSDTAHCTLTSKLGKTTADGGSTTHLKLKLDPPPVAGQEVWVLLSRHELSAKEKDHFIGVRVAAHWGTGAEAIAGTSVDDAVREEMTDDDVSMWLLMFRLL